MIVTISPDNKSITEFVENAYEYGLILLTV